MSTPVLSPVSLTSFYDPYSGAVLQASLYFYKAQSLDPFSVYTDSGLAIPHAQPVLTGGSGRVPPVWIGVEQPYRVRAFDQYGTLLEDIDNLPGALPPPTSGGGGSSGDLPGPTTPLGLTLLKTGDVFAAFAASATTREGAVRCNGGTIGPAAASPVPTERGNADCHALFVFLWQQDTAGLLTVSGGKGTTSEGDWTANKTITLPDLRGRTIVGTDPMGAAAASGRMTGATIAAGTVSVPGCNGGVATKTLAVTEIPSHTHGVNDPTHAHTVYDPTHAHGVSDPTHTHGGAVASHNHDYSRYISNSAAAGLGGNVSGLWQGTQSVNSQSVAPGLTINGAYTGIAIAAAGTGIGIYGAATGISIVAAGGGTAFSLAQPFLTMAYFIKL